MNSDDIQIFTRDEATFIYDTVGEFGYVVLGDRIVRYISPICQTHIRERLGTKWMLTQGNADELMRRHPTEMMRVIAKYKNDELEDVEGLETPPEHTQNQINAFACYDSPDGIPLLTHCIGDGSRTSIPIAEVIRILQSDDPEKASPDYFVPDLEADNSAMVAALKEYEHKRASATLIEPTEIIPYFKNTRFHTPN